MNLQWGSTKHDGSTYTGYVYRRVQNRRAVIVVIPKEGKENEELRSLLFSWGTMFGDWETDKLVKAISESNPIVQMAERIVVVGR